MTKLNMHTHAGPRLALFPMAMAALLLLAPASPLEGQFRVLPSVGLYAPLADLGEIRDTNGQVLLDAGRGDASLALGLGFEVGDPEGFAAFRGQLGYGTTREVPLESIECQGCELRSTLLTATAALVLRPVPRLGPIQPFFLAGGGIKRYGFDGDDFSQEGFIDGFRDQSRGSVQLGTGIQFTLGPIRPIVELSAHLSRYEVEATAAREGSDDLQADLFFTVAFPLGGR
jgi:hypothetical protein